MKVLLTCIAILIVGLLSGRHIGVLCSKHETREAVEQFVQAMESSEGAEAVRDVRAIELIEGGNNEAAVRDA